MHGDACATRAQHAAAHRDRAARRRCVARAPHRLAPDAAPPDSAGTLAQGRAALEES
ncbi:hypothetical protein M218_08495 [Burkholderia pseudomallei MSHR338]|nr:hypothetical protein BURPSS13_P0442 [Burkholderia pseudomallei S13]EEH27612.1 hypothetical protein BUH_2109 [Burkholderia pseudomallei Pakistan 9]EQA89544.1 hypothetical protein M218_08495 [Burkholderia pseudomallei MSHR338]VUD48393.1 hypothetical protein UKMH10_1702 [Burkholderia pseudomallei]